MNESSYRGILSKIRWYDGKKNLPEKNEVSKNVIHMKYYQKM